jgi:glutamyl-tRNA reductase
MRSRCHIDPSRLSFSRESLTGPTRSLGTGQQRVIVDLSLPHNVDKHAREVPGIRLLNLADIGAQHDRRGHELLEAARNAEDIVSEGVNRLRGRRDRGRLRMSA